MSSPTDDAREKRRHLVFWRTLVGALADEPTRAPFEQRMAELCADLDLPPLLLDDRASIRQVTRRHPDLDALFESMVPLTDNLPLDDDQLRREVLFSKLLIDVFGNGGQQSVSATQYAAWLDAVAAMERAFGLEPGQLHQGAGGGGRSTTGSGGGPEVTDSDVTTALDEIRRGRGLMAAPDIRNALQHTEKQLIDRMALREVLADRKLAERLQPSMALVEQLLRDKGNLSGEALRNAKALIRRFVDDVAAMLKKQVEQTPSGKVDPRVPPKRVFRNLDVRRTVWRNLTNWDPSQQRLMVDRLYFRRTAKVTRPTRLLVVVDQSGSMVPAMVNCTILASIFASLPKVDARLVAYDTRALDLTPWIADPFEVLLRTTLGGGTDGTCALPLVTPHITHPKSTVLVWISDFYDNPALLPVFEGLVRSGITFLPVGSVSTSGYFSVDATFRKAFAAMGTPLLSGSLKTLIRELKTALP